MPSARASKFRVEEATVSSGTSGVRHVSPARPSILVEKKSGKSPNNITGGGEGNTPRNSPDRNQSTPLVEEADRRFTRWFGEHYDKAALHGMLATIAGQRLEGDPVWLLLVGGSGDAKTETVQSAAGAGAIVTSTITSEGALLSGSSQKERAKDATGGLLRVMGDHGVLVIKDFTSILSMNRDARSTVLAALREVYDGKWERNVGSDGGKTLPWTGRIVVIGAVTTAWDSHHAVIASMGDRFVVLRLDSKRNRLSKGRQALDNVGAEKKMREELAEAVGRVLAGINTTPVVLTKDEREQLLRAADLVTAGRSSVETDYKGDPIDAHMPETPTRFTKQLAQIVRGACAFGIDRVQAMQLAMRCAHDSMPPARLSVLECLATGSKTVEDVIDELERPRTTVTRWLDSLKLLSLVIERIEMEADAQGNMTPRLHYALAEGVDPSVLSCPEKSAYGVLNKAEVCADISGRGPAEADPGARDNYGNDEN